MKIAILGHAGSGKSTLAKHLASYYGIPVLYLDAVNFREGWRERDREEAISLVAAAMDGKDWVIDGNYSAFLLGERLEQADHIVYLDFSRLSCLLRVCRRYFENRNSSRESMADGCLEKLDAAFIWWVLYRGRRAKKLRYYDGLLSKHREKVTIIKNQRQLRRFMQAPFGGDEK